MARIMKKTMTLLLAVLLLSSGSSYACVGKTLMVGTTGSLQQNLMAQMLSLLITERTGTTVKIVNFKSNEEAHQALLKADLDMYVEYTGVGQVQILGKAAIADAPELYKAVKDVYNQELNLVWLKPFGFEEKKLAPDGTVAEAAPVVRKDTLKKFPALARLINKLGGKVDTATIHKLEEQSAKGEEQQVKKVARDFLRQNRLI